MIAAVSGGADSVALLLVLHQLAGLGHLTLGGVAHLHHHIRGLDADEDAAFVGRLAERLSLPFMLEHADVPALAAANGQSLEVAGRHARLEFFARVAGDHSGIVALAHTRTDQAETLLLRLVRGAGARGLGGMAPRNQHRIRPFLEETRDDLRAWLTARGESWREDATNADSRIARNLVRLEVMPRLARLNPGVEAALARAARLSAADAAVLDRLAEVEAARLLHQDGSAVRFSMPEVRQLPEALARRVLRHALLIVWPGRMPTLDDTDAILASRANRVRIGAVELELNADLAVLSNRGATPAPPRPETGAADVLTLQVPGAVRDPAGRWEMVATGPVARSVSGTTRGDSTRVTLDAAALGRHLTIRSWRPGDRVQPLGLGGRKKLQDVFVDRKVPADERRYVPVVVAADGRIAWVAGHVIGEPFRVTPHSEAVVVLTLRH